jgi:hypothetical protein
MKTIKASTTTYRINEADNDFSALLAGIIQDHRKYLINCVINTGVDRYIDYKFSQRLSQTEINHLKRTLNGLKNTSINLLHYQPIVEAISRYDFYQLPNLIFYNEIDQRLKDNLVQTELNFNNSSPRTYEHE